MNNRFLFAVAVLVLTMTSVCHAAGQVAIGLKDVIDTVERSFKAGSNGEAPISDFTADFFQSTTLKKEGRELRGDGIISVRMATASYPLMYRFQYYRPFPQDIISDGNSLWLYHPQNREVILADVSAMYNRPGFSPDRDNAVTFLQGLGRISRDFHINYASGVNDQQGNYILELTPRRGMISIRRLLLVVSRDSVVSYVTGATPLTKGPTPTTAQNKPLPAPQRTPFSTPDPFARMPAFGGKSDPFPLLSTTVEDHDGNSTTLEFNNFRVNTRLTASDFTFNVPPNVQVRRPSEGNLPR